MTEASAFEGTRPQAVYCSFRTHGNDRGDQALGESRAEVMAEAFTDNKGNSFIAKKGLSTKYPITLLMVELAETLRMTDSFATLPREENTLADALTNLEFGSFSSGLREKLEEGDMKWKVMDHLMVSSQALFEEIAAHKRGGAALPSLRRRRRSISQGGPPE